MTGVLNSLSQQLPLFSAYSPVMEFPDRSTRCSPGNCTSWAVGTGQVSPAEGQPAHLSWPPLHHTVRCCSCRVQLMQACRRAYPSQGAAHQHACSLALQCTGLLAGIKGIMTAQPAAHAPGVGMGIDDACTAGLSARCLMPDAPLNLCQPLPELEALTSLLLVASTCRMQGIACEHPLLKVQLWHRASLHPLRLLVTAPHNVQMLGRM